jgi:hypothetical protein
METVKTIMSSNKTNANKMRLIAAVSFVIAIAFEVVAILLLRKTPVSTTWLIACIGLDLIFAVAGSLLWKKSNRLDPASKQETLKFFIQNQLGLIIAIIAFLPLVILVFTNKNMDGKQKGIVGSIAAIALIIAGVVGIDYNPPSLEQNSTPAEQVSPNEQDNSLTKGVDLVYWTKTGKSYHLYKDCSYITTERTKEIFEGSLGVARDSMKITDLCDRCANRAKKEKETENQE